jgi:hypothetical protein
LEQEALHIKRRKEVWEQVQAGEESARNSRTLPKPKTGRGNKQFANEVASNRTQLIACYPNEYLYCTLIRFGGTAL